MSAVKSQKKVRERRRRQAGVSNRRGSCREAMPGGEQEGLKAGSHATGRSNPTAQRP